MENFELIKKIGKGAFGTVFLARDNTKTLVAVKIYFENIDWENIENSLELAMQLHHPNLVICKTFFHDRLVTEENMLSGRSTVNLCAVLEYVDGVNLFTAINLLFNKNIDNDPKKSHKKIDSYLTQIVNGLRYIHSKGMIHCDIKPENILISIDKLSNLHKVKIIDYDFLIDKPKEKNIGTPLFISPEIYAKKKYDEKTDNWSLGVTIYYCLTEKYPFNANNLLDLKKLILSEYTPDFFEIPSKYLQIVKGLLIKDVKNRLSLNQVLMLF